jgi:DNA-binding transcriptional ArsR family regulator
VRGNERPARQRGCTAVTEAIVNGLRKSCKCRATTTERGHAGADERSGRRARAAGRRHRRAPGQGLLANPNRLLLLCHISQGERSVTEIQRDLGLKQPALSQQLAELRQSGLVESRRESRSIYYSIKDDRTRNVIGMLHAIFCADDEAEAAAAAAPARPLSRPAPPPLPTGDAAAFARLDDQAATIDQRPHSGARS